MTLNDLDIRILDVCVGSEKIYSNLHKELDSKFLSMDIRKGDFSFKNKSMVAPTSIIIQPKILADMKTIPFKDNSIDVIVFDPPHMDLGVLTGFWTKAYGSWTKEETLKTLEIVNEEFNRILTPKGQIILKIMPTLSDIYLKLLNNFYFYMPIRTVNKRGCIQTKEEKLAAIWYLGIKVGKT